MQHFHLLRTQEHFVQTKGLSSPVVCCHGLTKPGHLPLTATSSGSDKGKERPWACPTGKTAGCIVGSVDVSDEEISLGEPRRETAELSSSNKIEALFKLMENMDFHGVGVSKQIFTL